MWTACDLPQSVKEAHIQRKAAWKVKTHCEQGEETPLEHVVPGLSQRLERLWWVDESREEHPSIGGGKVGRGALNRTFWRPRVGTCDCNGMGHRAGW